MPKIITRYSTTANAVPTSGDLEIGELAVNLTDRKLYSKRDSSTVVTIAQGAGGSWVEILSQTADVDATVDFIHGTAGCVLDNTYDDYCVVLRNVVPDTDSASLYLLTSTDGVNFDVGASNYSYWYENGVTGSSGSSTQIILATVIGSDTNENGLCGELHFSNPETAQYFQCRFMSSHIGTDGLVDMMQAAGARTSAGDVTGIRFLFSSGNVESGTLTLYGRRK